MPRARTSGITTRSRPKKPLTPRTVKRLPRESLLLHLNHRGLAVSGTRAQLADRLRRDIVQLQPHVRGGASGSGAQSPPASPDTTPDGSDNPTDPGQRSQSPPATDRSGSDSSDPPYRPQRRRSQSPRARHSSPSSAHHRIRVRPRPFKQRGRIGRSSSSSCSPHTDRRRTVWRDRSRSNSSASSDHQRGRSSRRRTGRQSNYQHRRHRKHGPRWRRRHHDPSTSPSSDSSTSSSSSSGSDTDTSSDRKHSMRKHVHHKKHSRRHRRHPRRHSRHSPATRDWLDPAISGDIPCAPPLSRHIRHRIRRGKYVRFDKLLLPPNTPFVQQITNPAKHKKKHATTRQVHDGASWLEAWNRYLCTRLSYHISMALELAKYQTMMAMFFMHHPPAACITYDKLFWQAAAADRTLRWDCIKEDIYIWSLTQRHTPFRGSFRDKVPITARLGPPTNPTDPLKPPLNCATHTADGKEICKRYNASKCTRGDDCIYAHTCWHATCLGQHPGKVCPRKTTFSIREGAAVPP